jgi:hypothetical protein
MAQKKNCGGARIATICDAGAGYGFSKHLLPLTIGTQGKSYMRCGAFFVGTFPLGGRTNVVPDVCSLVTFPVNVGRKRDECRLAERSSDETDPHRHAEYVCRRHINDGITWSPGQPRAGEDEVIREDQIGGPARCVGGRDDSIEVKPAQRQIEADTRQVIDLQRVVIRHASGRAGEDTRREARITKIWIGIHRLCEGENFLAEVRHLGVGVGIVEINGSL